MFIQLNTTNATDLSIARSHCLVLYKSADVNIRFCDTIHAAPNKNI